MTKTEKKSSADANQFPLFFKNPAPLDATRHATAGITSSVGYGFAKITNSIPLNAAEFMMAAKHYPIVFTGDDEPTPVAIVGLEQENYFVNDKGDWREDTYIPAYVRKYPFAFSEFAEGTQLALCVDEEAEHFIPKSSGKNVSKFYEAGKPTAFTNNALEFCTAFHNHFVVTKQFTSAIKKEGLLIPNQSEAQLANGRKILLGGFDVIDQEKFNALSDEKIALFRKHNWLPLIYFLLQSTSNWQTLVDMAVRVEKPKNKHNK